MSESTDAAAGGRRGGRTVSKSTPDAVSYTHLRAHET